MDSKFIIIAIFLGINAILIQAEKELNIDNMRIFSISGSNEFRRHHHLEIDPPDEIQIDEDAGSLLKKYLILKSRQENEYLDIKNKKRDGGQLSLQSSFVQVMEKSYIAMSVYYEGLIRSVKSTYVSFPLPKIEPGDSLYFTDDMEPEERYKTSYTHQIKIEQQIVLEDIQIRGILAEEKVADAKANAKDDKYHFKVSLVKPQMKAVYVRTPTRSQGIVTKSLYEVLTFNNITMNITFDGVKLKRSLDVTGNPVLQRKIAEMWLAPVLEAIKNQHTLIEILYQSEVYFSKYIRHILLRITDKIRSAMNDLTYINDLENVEEDDVGDFIKFLSFANHQFEQLRISYYDSVVEPVRESSCSHQYLLSHFIYLKFESVATSMNYPQVQYFGVKKVTEKGEKMEQVVSDSVPVKELSLKFEIRTDKAGIPVTMTTDYRLTLKLEIDDAHPEKEVHLRMQQKLPKLMAEHFQEKINNLMFGSSGL